MKRIAIKVIFVIAVLMVINMIWKCHIIKEKTKEEIETLNQKISEVEIIIKVNEKVIDSLKTIKVKQDENITNLEKDLEHYKNLPISNDYTNMPADSAVREFIRRHGGNRH